MSTPYIVSIPAAPFREALVALTSELVASAAHTKAFAMSSLFNYIELTTSNADLQRQLLARGVFSPQLDGTYLNKAKPIDEMVYDISPAIGELQVYLPRTVQLRPVVSGNDLDLELVKTRILATFFNPPAPGLGNRYVLSVIRLRNTWAEYEFVSEDASAQDVHLKLDYLLDATPLAHGTASAGFVSADLQLMAASMFLENNCCGGFRAKVVCVTPPGHRCVTVHAKILYSPTMPVADQIAGLNSVFSSADLEAKLGSIEVLNIPDLLDVEVGECRGNAVTDDQRRLFGNRNNAGPNDICAYWVRSLIPGPD